MKKHLTIIFLFLFQFLNGQGIFVKIKYEPTFLRLEKSNLLKDCGIFDATNESIFNNISEWNQAACIDNKFNYFSILNGHCFDSIAYGSYRFIDKKDKNQNYKGFPENPFWINNLSLGANEVELSDGTKSQITNSLALYAIETPSNYFKNLGLNFDDVIKNNPTKNKLNDLINIDLFKYNLKNQEEFSFKCNINIAFTNTVNVSIKTTDSTNNLTLINKIDEIVSGWALSNYPYTFSDSIKLNIYTYKTLAIDINKTNNISSVFIRNYNFEEKKNMFEEINAQFKIPTKTFCVYNMSSIRFSLNNENTQFFTKNTPSKIELPGKISLYPLFAFTGFAHYCVYKKNYRNKWLPRLTLGAVGAFGLSWLGRNLLYNWYKALPQERNIAYIWSNGFNKAMILAAIPFSVGVALDLNKTIQGTKVLKQKLIKITQ